MVVVGLKRDREPVRILTINVRQGGNITAIIDDLEDVIHRVIHRRFNFGIPTHRIVTKFKIGKISKGRDGMQNRCNQPDYEGYYDLMLVLYRSSGSARNCSKVEETLIERFIDNPRCMNKDVNRPGPGTEHDDHAVYLMVRTKWVNEEEEKQLVSLLNDLRPPSSW